MDNNNNSDTGGYIDSHFHTNLKTLLPDAEKYFETMREKGMKGIVVGIDKESSLIAIEQVGKNEHIWATVGLHPAYVAELSKEELIETLEFLENIDYGKYKKIVAIGECGLDYFYGEITEDEKKNQKEVFLAQCDIGRKNDLPLMIHVRPSKDSQDAYLDFYKIITKESRAHGLHFHLHFYAGDLDTTKKFIKFGCTFGFDGPITFTSEYDEVLNLIPLESILFETDSPYAAPIPHRRETCYPWYVEEVYKTYTEKTGRDLEEVKTQIEKNFKRIYKI